MVDLWWFHVEKTRYREMLALFNFHSFTVHLDTMESFIYPTDAQLDCSKMLKFTWGVLLHVSVNYNFSKAHSVALWWWSWKTETCSSTSRVNFNVNFNIFRAICLCISWINKRLYLIKHYVIKENWGTEITASHSTQTYASSVKLSPVEV